jgi:hypothetical protein
MRKNLSENFLVFILYIILFILEWFFINLFQNLEVAIAASLIYLPHGLRVIATILRGSKILPGLFLGHFLTGYYMQLSDGLVTNTDLIATLLTSLGGTLSAYIAIFILKYFKNYSGSITLNNILIIALISSVINSLASNITYYVIYKSWDAYVQFLLFIMGDLIGAIVLFYFLKFTYGIIKDNMNNI